MKRRNSSKKTRHIPAVNFGICIGCGNCVNICPLEAMMFVDGKVSIEEDQCNGCLLCATVCPVEAIS